MSLIKGISKYFVILLLLVVGTGTVMGAVLILFPSASIFGIKYISYIDNYNIACLVTEEQHESYIGTFDNVVINAVDLNVTVVPANVEYNNIKIEANLSFNGFYNSTEQAFSIDDPYIEDGNLYINFNTVNGFVNYAKRAVVIYLPINGSNIYLGMDTASQAQCITDGILPVGDITINTGSGSAVISSTVASGIDNDTEENEVLHFDTDSISVQSTSGSININNCYIYDADLETTSGSIGLSRIMNDLGNDQKGVENNLTLESNTGRILLGDGVNINNICTINSFLSEITLNDVNYRVIYEGQASYLSMGTVTGQVTINSPDARIVIDKVIGTEAEIVNTNGEGISYQIGEIDASIVVLDTSYGNIHIDKLSSTTATTITTVSGSVVIDEIIGTNDSIDTTHSLKITTQTGNITVSQSDLSNDEALNCLIRSAIIDLETNSGTVRANNIAGQLLIKINNNGLVYANIVEINADSTINGKNGQVVVNLPNAKYTVATQSSRSVDVSLLNLVYTTIGLTTGDVVGVGENTGKTIIITNENANLIARIIS